VSTGTHLEADIVLARITNANNYPQSEHSRVFIKHTQISDEKKEMIALNLKNDLCLGVVLSI
jgi:hypothetical protein